MIRLDLIASTIAKFVIDSVPHELDVKRGGVICTAARRILDLGVSPDSLIDVRRNGQPAFNQKKPVSWWAARTVAIIADRVGYRSGLS